MTTPDAAAEIREGAEPSGPWAQSAKLAFRFLFLAVCLAAAGWLVSNFRQVPPESRAMVYRFGQLVRQQGAGLLMAWPQPIEKIVILPSEDRQIEFRVDQFEPDSACAPRAISTPSWSRGPNWTRAPAPPPAPAASSCATT